MYGEVTNIQTGTGGLRSEAIFSVHDNPCRALLYWPLNYNPVRSNAGSPFAYCPQLPASDLTQTPRRRRRLTTRTSSARLPTPATTRSAGRGGRCSRVKRAGPLSCASRANPCCCCCCWRTRPAAGSRRRPGARKA